MMPRALLTRQLDRSAGDCVVLTFDDGPHPEVTPEVLDRLDAHEARAVFFIVGRRAERAPHLLEAIQDRGHLLGNHTYLHSNGRQTRFSNYYHDLQKCQLLIEKHAGKKPKLFRPALGTISLTTLITPKLLDLKTISWSVEAKDWKCRTPEEALFAAQSLIYQLGPRDIILLHDDNPLVLQILDIILPTIKNRRYDICSGIHYL